MTVWTLTNSWIEGDSSDTILMGVYATRELAQKAMRDDFNEIIHNDTFELKELTASATVGGKYYRWEIEEREVQDENKDS